MSRFLSLMLLFFVVPYASHVFGKVHEIRQSAEFASPFRIALKDSVPMETDDVIGGLGFGDGSKRRFKRATSVDNERLIVNMSILPDEGHNEAIVHWSGMHSMVMFLLTRRTNRNGTTVDSTLYRSTDYGSTFPNITSKLSGKPVIHYYYVCPKNASKLVFVDLLNKKLYVTRDEGKSFTAHAVSFSPDHLLFHPKEQNQILAYTHSDRALYASLDLGRTWTMVYAMVNPRYYWAVEGHDYNMSTVHLEAEDTATGKYRYHAVKSPYPTEVPIDPDFGYIDVGSVVVQNEYIFVQKSVPRASYLYVSYHRGPFKRCFFPNNAHPADFYIVKASEQQVFIAASHRGGTVTLYLSDVTGQFYVKSLDHVVAFVHRDNFILDLYEVRGLPGTFIVNQHRPGALPPQTLITFNRGGFWSPIAAPKLHANGQPTNCHLPNCSLYLHLQVDPMLHRIPMPQSDDNAPGIILAQGRIGGSGEGMLFMSQDAGLNWTAVMPGYYRQSILDQGGAIVMIPRSAEHPDITYILYSCTEGNTWENYSLPLDRRIKADGMLNEPGITSLITSIYGHTSRADSRSGWIVVKIDFSQILSQPCNASSYYKWYPTSGLTSGKCLLGRSLEFERRKQDVECFNGKYYERYINATPCVCSQEDFECDYGFELNATNHCVAASWFNASVPVVTCEFGQSYRNSSGYRKVAADKCQGGSLVQKYRGVNVTCPVIKPAGLSIITDGSVIPVNKNVTFTLTQEQGSHEAHVTNYMWNFGDGSDRVVVNGFKKAKSHHHIFTKTGLFAVRVTAANAKGSAETLVRVWVQDKLSGLYLTTSHAVKVDSPVTFELVPIMLHGHYVQSSSSARTNDVHYLWLFGDETADEKGTLSWLPKTTHTYGSAANYTVWMEAFTGVGSVFYTSVMPVYGTLTTVELSLSGIRLPFGQVDTVFEDIVAHSLHQVLTFELGVDEWRLVVSYDQMFMQLARVSVLPRQQTMTSDSSIDEIVDKLVLLANQQKIHFTLPDTAFGNNDEITVTGASIKSGTGSTLMPNTTLAMVTDVHGSSNVVGIAVGVTLGILVLAVCGVLIFFYRKRLQRTRHYSVLHSRYHDNNADMVTNLLAESDDDDDALIDPMNLESSAHHRLALNEHDDDEPLCARIIMSESGGGGDTNDPANC